MTDTADQADYTVDVDLDPDEDLGVGEPNDPSVDPDTNPSRRAPSPPQQLAPLESLGVPSAASPVAMDQDPTLAEFSQSEVAAFVNFGPDQLPIFPTGALPGRDVLPCPINRDQRRERRIKALKDELETGVIPFSSIEVSNRTRGLKFHWTGDRPQGFPPWFIVGLQSLYEANRLQVLETPEHPWISLTFRPDEIARSHQSSGAAGSIIGSVLLGAGSNPPQDSIPAKRPAPSSRSRSEPPAKGHRKGPSDSAGSNPQSSASGSAGLRPRPSSVAHRDRSGFNPAESGKGARPSSVHPGTARARSQSSDPRRAHLKARSQAKGGSKGGKAKLASFGKAQSHRTPEQRAASAEIRQQSPHGRWAPSDRPNRAPDLTGIQARHITSQPPVHRESGCFV